MPFEKWRSTITVMEICHRLGLCPETVYALLANGTIPSLRPFRRYIISREAYKKWEASIGGPGFSHGLPDVHPETDPQCNRPDKPYDPTPPKGF